jgi:hypothetical protein
LNTTVEHGVQLDPSAHDAVEGAPDLGHAVDPGGCGDHLVLGAGRGDDDRRRSGAAGEVAPEHLLAPHRLHRGLVDEEVGLGDPGRAQLRDQRGAGEQQQRGADPDRPGAPAHRVGDPGPQPAPLVGPAADPGAPRPERGAAGQQQGRGQEGERGQHGGADADRRDRAEAAVGVQPGQQQAQQAQRDRAGRGQDRSTEAR